MKVVQTIQCQRGTAVSRLKWSTVNLNEFNREEVDLVIRLASSSEDTNIISIWNANDGKLIQELHEINNFQAVKVNGNSFVFFLEKKFNFLLLIFNHSKKSSGMFRRVEKTFSCSIRIAS